MLLLVGMASQYTAESLVAAVKTLQHDPTFQQRAQGISVLLRHAGGVTRVTDVVDMSLALGKDILSFLRSPVVSQSFLLQHDVDVVVFLIACAVAIVLIPWVLMTIRTPSSTTQTKKKRA